MIVPNCNKNFRPLSDNTYAEERQPINCVETKNICIKFPFPGIASFNIEPPYKITTLTPHNCCNNARWIAIIVLKFFDF
jgi:hypothetical protein